MVDRVELDGLRALGPSQAVRQSTMIDRRQPVPTGDTEGDTVSRILQGLSQFTDVASDVAFKEAQKQNELSKIEGMNLALSGGKLGEEMTKAHETGYDMVTSQSDLMKANEQLARQIQANPMMSDEELSQAREQAYGGVLSEYQDKSPEVFKALSIKAQESQGVLYNMQQKARQNYQQQKGIETLNNLIGSSVDGARSIADGKALINQYMAQGKQLGLDEFTVKEQIFQQMKLSASMGDNRLLEFVKATDWGHYTMDVKQGTAAYKQYQKQVQAEIKAAQAQARAAMAEQNAVAYGIGLAQAERMAKGGATDAEILGQLKSLQAKGMKLSASTVASYLTMGKTASQAQIDLSNNLSTWQADRGNFNLAQNPKISPEDKKKVLGAAEEAIVKQGEQLPTEQQGDFIIQNLFNLSKQEDMPVPRITTALTSLANIDPQQPISSSVQTWTKYLLSADDQTIRRNVPGEKDQKMLFGMRDVLMNSQGADAEQALRTAISRGQMVRDSNVQLNAQQNKVLSNKSLSAVKKFEDPTESTWYFKAKGLPDASRDFVTNQINARAKDLYQITGDPDKAVDLAQKEYRANNMVLSGGITANIGTKQLAAKVPGFVKGDKDDAEIVQMRAVSALDYQVSSILKAQSKADGVEYKRGDARVIFSNSGDTYQINVGGLVTGTYPTAGLTEQFNENYFKQWSAVQDKERAESEAWRAIKDSRELDKEFLPRMD